MTPFQQRIGRLGIQYLTAAGLVAYRLSGGRVAGRVPSGAPICVLTTIGRRTSRRRSVPLLYLTDGDDLVVVASRGGMERHPAWYLNVQANPEVVVETGRQRRAMWARAATPEEKARWWPELVAAYEHFAAYQTRTARDLPVVLLRRRRSDDGCD